MAGTRQRPDVRMTEDEVGAFLAAGRTLHLATIGRDGTPHVVPMGYAILEGNLAMWAYAKSQKVVNLRRDPRLTCLIDTGERHEEIRGVQIRGRAHVLEDPVAVQAVGELIYQRYLGPLTPPAREFVARKGQKRVAIVVVAERAVSFDYRKLGFY